MITVLFLLLIFTVLNCKESHCIAHIVHHLFLTVSCCTLVKAEIVLCLLTAGPGQRVELHVRCAGQSVSDDSQRQSLSVSPGRHCAAGHGPHHAQPGS